MTNVNSEDIRCYQRTPGAGANGVLNVTAGQALPYNAKASISHPGPMAFYIAQVPQGESAKTWDGKGKVWSKIYQDQPKLGGGMTWPTQGLSLVLLHSYLTQWLTQQHRRKIRQRHNPQVPQGRRLPAACRTHWLAFCRQRRRRPVLHLVRADHG